MSSGPRAAENANGQAANAAGGAPAAASRAIATWGLVHVSLTPVIGARGMHALFRRAVQLTQQQHRLLAPLWDDPSADPNYLRLLAALQQAPEAQAHLAHVALLRCFRDLLTHLVGASLTERLLQPVRDLDLLSPPAKDPAP